MGRISILIVQIGWLLLLGALAATYFIDPKLILFGRSLPSVPLAIVWFGALGAVLISLTGIVEHAHDWDDSFALCHLSRLGHVDPGFDHDVGGRVRHHPVPEVR